MDVDRDVGSRDSIGPETIAEDVNIDEEKLDAETAPLRIAPTQVGHQPADCRPPHKSFTPQNIMQILS